jgi:hypothetical protein
MRLALHALCHSACLAGRYETQVRQPTTCPSTAVGSTWRNQDQADTGTLSGGDHQLGCTIVVYAGHPLVGRIVPVVRRYGQRGAARWVIELPDGSRQYIPASWCSPLSSSRGTLPVPAPLQDGQPPPGVASSPLSLAALRDLAALVRRLREAAGQCGEEPDDAGQAPSEDSPPGGATKRAAQPPSDTARNAGVAELGELPRGGSTPGGQRAPANGPPPGGRRAGEPLPDDVRRP